jgi:hypothetical protein
MITTLTTASGNPYIDGLTLEPGQSTPVIYTPGSTITYFFDTELRAWSDVEKVAVRAAWESWDRLIDLNIEETTDRSAATVLMQISTLPEGVLAEATAPVDGVVPATNKTNGNDALKYIDFGGDSFLTLIHEIGHNLGIYHPHGLTTFPGVSAGEEQNMGDLNMNQHIWTVLSYVIGYDQEPVIDPSFGTSMTPMTLDIAAAQFAYGAAESNTGDNTYAIPTQNAVGTGWTAIWDSGGIDTISAQGATAATTIDLRAATLEGQAPGGYVSWTGGIKGGFTIAQGVLVENAIGGSAGDTITGNAAANVISGGGGNDKIDAGGGEDTAQIAAAISAVTVTIDANGTISVTDRNGTEGTDTLSNIETLAFTDRTLDLNAFSGLTQLSDTQFKALAEMYVAYFNRAPDAEGLFYWADKLAEGRTMDQIAERFFDQDETRGIYTDPSNTDAFVTAVYANVLGRTPDAEGSAFWTGKLAANEVTQGAFVLKIILGAKNGGGPQDVAYLSDKTDLGIYFSAIKGLSDSADGRQVMSTFGDQATSNKTGAKTAIDGHYADATASSGGEFLFDLVGIVADPFAAIV